MVQVAFAINFAYYWLLAKEVRSEESFCS